MTLSHRQTSVHTNKKTGMHAYLLQEMYRFYVLVSIFSGIITAFSAKNMIVRE